MVEKEMMRDPIKIPKFDVETISIKLLKPFKKNAKKHPKEQVERIATSIQEFGFRKPILLNNLNEKEIVAGHGRLLAAILLNMSEVPCISLDDMTKAQATAFRIMDNKSAESDWNLELLKEGFKELETMNFDLELTGFDFSEINDILGTEKVEDESNSKEVDQLGKLQITCPNCGTKFNKKMSDNA